MSARATGYFTATYRSSLDDTEQPFALWVPRTYTARRAYPLIVALHGSDADHRMIPEECFRLGTRDFREDALLLSPFGRGDVDFAGPGELDLWEAMQWVRTNYRVDARRQYLTGLSLGGYATWRLACAHPGQWAAVAPVCGGGDPAALAALRDVPVWCVHGRRDDVVPVEESRRLVAELQRLGRPVRYTELPDGGHRAWEWLYDPDRSRDSLADWLLGFRRRRAAAPVLAPTRTGGLDDLFTGRVLVSSPARTPIPREAELLRGQAEAIARFSWGDKVMRSGRLPVRTDEALTLAELRSANVLILGRSDNHRWLAAAGRKLLARHVAGRLQVAGETYLGKSLLALTVQPSPWNPQHLLGVITYQQFRQMRDVAGLVLAPPQPLGRVSLYDTLQRRFLRRS